MRLVNPDETGGDWGLPMDTTMAIKPTSRNDEESIPLWASDMRDELRSLNRAIRGENGDPGLVGKVANLEKGYEAAQKIIIALAVSTIGLLITLVIQHLLGQ